MTLFIKVGEFVAKNAVAIGTAIATGVAGYIAGKKGVFDRKSTTTTKRKAKKRGNSKKASGNRKAQAKKVVKKVVQKAKAVGEKSTALSS